MTSTTGYIGMLSGTKPAVPSDGAQISLLLLPASLSPCICITVSLDCLTMQVVFCQFIYLFIFQLCLFLFY